MARKRKDIVDYLLAHPDMMLLKKPFTRGCDSPSVSDYTDGNNEDITRKRKAVLPRIYKTIISQERYAKELDPECHEVLFDENLPKICVKIADSKGGMGYRELEYKRFALAFQDRIREKKTLSLCGKPREFTLHDSNPSDGLKRNYADFKWHWQSSNQDGMELKVVHTQFGYGDAGLLMYFNEKNEICSRLISYEDGYVIISHDDDNGDRVMECVYYRTPDGVEHLTCYDDTYVYEFVSGVTSVRTSNDSSMHKNGWTLTAQAPHGFSEIPLVTKRGAVAWDKVQSLIELFEIIYNIFAVIQKRHGWGILYIKGNFKQEVQKIAGSIILNDTSIDKNGSAEFKTPPSPQGTIDFLQDILNQIQIGCGVTFILPKDVKTGGDISGLAIQMTRSLDIESAARSVIEWQDFADKHCRLFKEGLAKQLVLSGENPNAITEFADMKISCKFKPWQPFDESAYNQMLCTLKGSGLISTKTGIEKNTVSAPDEEVRLQAEQEANATTEPTTNLEPQE